MFRSARVGRSLLDDSLGAVDDNRVGMRFAHSILMSPTNPDQTRVNVAFRETDSRPKLLDQVRNAIRMRHYSRRTEQTYVAWIRRFNLFHRKTHPATIGAQGIGGLSVMVRDQPARQRVDPESGA